MAGYKKRRLSKSFQGFALSKISSRFSWEAKLDDFSYVLLRIMVPQLKIVGGSDYGYANQHRVLLFNKVKKSFSLRLFVKLIKDEHLGPILHDFLTSEALDAMADMESRIGAQINELGILRDYALHIYKA